MLVCSLTGVSRMQVLPHDVKQALEFLRADPARERSAVELAKACGVGRRTLEKHFRRFLGRSLVEVQRDLRLELAARPAAGPTGRRRDPNRAALRFQSPWPLCGALSHPPWRKPVGDPATIAPWCRTGERLACRFFLIVSRPARRGRGPV